MLSPREAAILQALLEERERQDSNNSLKSFTQAAWHLVEPAHNFVDGWHIDATCEHLEAVFYGQIKNLIINVPPRHMKSLEVSVMFPAWAWTKRPSLRWLFASYAASLSIRDSVKCRRIIESSWYQDRFGGVYQLTSDQNAKQKYENDKTGHRIATSVDGSGTGEGGDIIVVDDPHKVNEAESEAIRQGVLDWWDGEMTSRGNDPKTVAKIIVMQRVHEKDLSGHLLAKESGWDHLCLPAEYEFSLKKKTSIGWSDPRKKEGELLWPQRFGETELSALKKELGAQRSAGQLQQRPAPAEGIIFKREYWKYYGGKGQRMKPEKFDFLCLSVDLPFDEGKKNSFAVFQTWGKVGPDKFLLDEMRAQIAFPAQIAMFKAAVAKWNPHAKWVEKKANGAALISTLQTEIAGVLPIEPHGSKIMRAEAVSPECQSGNVYLPDASIASWIGDYVEELAVFPNGEFNDRVDATSQALMKMRESIATDFVPISITGASKWLRR